ncbi:MAG: hypothetical protein AW07_03919 [Candidatus Accumulibacter sp. SK-11]|nr:MAG: hypothetical protein AW07_03919 [Candidatus Accumulibacter sp. SK-11]
MTLPSSPIAYRNFCSGPVCTACAGTVSAPPRVRGDRLTLTNMPGHSRPSGLAKRALTRIVPLALSTLLSMKLSLPSSAGCPGESK